MGICCLGLIIISDHTGQAYQLLFSGCGRLAASLKVNHHVRTLFLLLNKVGGSLMQFELIELSGSY